MMSANFDRTVHATSRDGDEVVRYDRSGKYRLERADGTRANLGLQTAVTEAMLFAVTGGTIYLGRPGGMRFDAEVRKRERYR